MPKAVYFQRFLAPSCICFAYFYLNDTLSALYFNNLFYFLAFISMQANKWIFRTRFRIPQSCIAPWKKNEKEAHQLHAICWHLLLLLPHIHLNIWGICWLCFILRSVFESQFGLTCIAYAVDRQTAKINDIYFSCTPAAGKRPVDSVVNP